MNKLNRRGLLILGIMSIALPLWLTVGKLALFNAGGWMTLIYLLQVVPIIFVVFWVLFILLAKRKDVRETKSIGSFDSVILILLYVSIFIHGIFLVDGGDTDESINSVAMNIFGMNQSVSSELSQFFSIFAIVMAVIALVVFIYKLISKRSLKIY